MDSANAKSMLTMIAMRRFLSAIGLAALVVILASGCRTEETENRIIPSPVVPFGQFLGVADTISLDPSVIIGSVSVLDVSEQGELLVTDHVGRCIHRFLPSGEYVRSYAHSDCLPDEAGFMAFSYSRFLGSGQVMAMNFTGSAVILDEAGNCVEATR